MTALFSLCDLILLLWCLGFTLWKLFYVLAGSCCIDRRFYGEKMPFLRLLICRSSSSCSRVSRFLLNMWGYEVWWPRTGFRSPFDVWIFGFFASAKVIRLTKWSVVSWILLIQLLVIMFMPEMGSSDCALVEFNAWVADVCDLKFCHVSAFLVVEPPT